MDDDKKFKQWDDLSELERAIALSHALKTGEVLFFEMELDEEITIVEPPVV